MRERTPSADDTPKRAPPAPPGEADVAVRKATDVASAAAYGASKMVASTHSLDDLGVNHIASASQQHQNHHHHQQSSQQATDKQHHGHPYGKSLQSAQDKRSRLSNVINNLRKKVPPEVIKCDSPAIKEESGNRSGVGHHLQTLEKYMMTVLNGVIEDEEKNAGKKEPESERTSKDLVAKPAESAKDAKDPDGAAVAVPSREEDTFPAPKVSFEPSEANENKVDAAIPLVDESGNKDINKTAECEKKKEVDSSRDTNVTGISEPSGTTSDGKDVVDACESRNRCQIKNEANESPRSLGAIILDRLNDRHQDQQPTEEIKKDFVDSEIRTICKELLNDILNDVIQGFDRSNQTSTDKDIEPISDSSMQGLHCSLPLDKVASVLPSCQTPSSPSLQTTEVIPPVVQTSLSKTSSPLTAAKNPTKSPTKLVSPTVKHLCLYCDRKFPSISLRQRHTERVHQTKVGRRSERNSRKPTQQNCQYCVDKSSENLEGLFQHMVGSHSDKYHGCLQCSTRYLTKDALTSHIHEIHSHVTVQMEKLKEPIPTSVKELKSFSAKEESNSVVKQSPAKDQPSHSGSSEFDNSFYKHVICNIRENLLHHIDGKLQANSQTAASPSSSLAATNNPTASPENSSKTPQYQLPIDISLTAVTPVYSKDYSKAPEDFGNSSENADKPGKSCNRTHPRRISFEKYNFPRKYDNKEQWTCSIKDLSKFDISTQLTLRKKQLFIKECTTLNRLDEVTKLTDDKQRTEDEKKNVVDNVVNLVENNIVMSASDDKVTDSVQSQTVVKCDDNSDSDKKDGDKCANESLLSEKIAKEESIVFNSEFESFMRLKKRSAGSNEIKNDVVAYAELTGEWSRPRVYICGACAERYVTLRELEDHKSTAHPNVWCMHFEFAGEQRELHKHLVFLPHRSGSPSLISSLVASSTTSSSSSSPTTTSVKTRQQTTAAAAAAALASASEPPASACTKCTKGCASLAELHRHMLECGGDQAWLLGLFGNGKKKCKWRPFGSRSRRRRQRGMKRNIQNSQTPRNNVPKEKPQHTGPRVRPSDRESIQKMLANLPAKRSTRKVLQENAMVRSQGRLRSTQSRAGTVDVRSKAVLRNKLLKNAKSFHRKKNLREERQEKEASRAEDAPSERLQSQRRLAEAPTSNSTATKGGKLLRNVRVLGKRRNVRAASIDQQTVVRRKIKLRSSAAPSADDAAPSEQPDGLLKQRRPSYKTEQQQQQLDDQQSKGSKNKRKKGRQITDPLTAAASSSALLTGSLGVSGKSKSQQLRNNDGKFARRQAAAGKPGKLGRRPLLAAGDSARLLTRSKLRAAAKLAWKEHTRISRRITRLASLDQAEKSFEAASEVALVAMTAMTSTSSSPPPSREQLDTLDLAEPAALLPKVKLTRTVSRNSMSSRRSLDGAEDRAEDTKASPSPVVLGRGRRPRREVASSAPSPAFSSTSDDATSSARQSAIEPTTSELKTRSQRSSSSMSSRLTAPRAESKTTRRSIASKDSGVTTSKEATAPLELPKKNAKNVAEAASVATLPAEDKDNVSLSTRSSFKARKESVVDIIAKKIAIAATEKRTKRLPKDTTGKKNKLPVSEKFADSETSMDIAAALSLKKDNEKTGAVRKSLRNKESESKDIIEESTKFNELSTQTAKKNEEKDSDVTAATDISNPIEKEEIPEVTLQSVAKKTVSGKRRGRIKRVFVDVTESKQSEAPISNEETLPTQKLEDIAQPQVPVETEPPKDPIVSESSDPVTASLDENITDTSVSSNQADTSNTNVVNNPPNLSLEHLQQESSNSNLDSGKENSSELIDVVIKPKLTRPKKTRGSRGKTPSAGKRSLSSVIGILTEGINVPTGPQGAATTVLTAQTSLESEDTEVTENTLASNDQSVVENGIFSIEPENSTSSANATVSGDVSVNDKKDCEGDAIKIEEVVKINEKPEEQNVTEIVKIEAVRIETAVLEENKESETVVHVAVEKMNETVEIQPHVIVNNVDSNPNTIAEKEDVNLKTTTISENKVTTVESMVEVTADKKIDAIETKATVIAEPTTDIILDLSRRKPKGKGSFLEKIVSKIAKQKDVSLEGESVCHLDSGFKNTENLEKTKAQKCNSTKVSEEIANKDFSLKEVAVVNVEVSVKSSEAVTEIATPSVKLNEATIVNSVNITECTVLVDDRKNENVADTLPNSNKIIDSKAVEETLIIVADDVKTNDNKVDSEVVEKSNDTVNGAIEKIGLEKSVDLSLKDVVSKKPVDVKQKVKKNSKKRSLESSSPKRNKRKPVVNESVEEEEDTEEICLADIMKLIDRSRSSEKHNKLNEDIGEEPVKPGKRKNLDDETEFNSSNENIQTDASSSMADEEKKESIKKSKRKGAQKKNKNEIFKLASESDIIDDVTDKHNSDVSLENQEENNVELNLINNSKEIAEKDISAINLGPIAESVGENKTSDSKEIVVQGSDIEISSAKQISNVELSKKQDESVNVVSVDVQNVVSEDTNKAEMIVKPKKRGRKKNSEIAKENELCAKSQIASDNSLETPESSEETKSETSEKCPIAPNDSFKIPEFTEVTKSSKKRFSKRKSNIKDFLTEQQSEKIEDDAQKQSIDDKSDLSNDNIDQNSSMSESEENSVPKRRSKRSTRSSRAISSEKLLLFANLKESDDSDVSSANEMESSRCRRSQRKHVAFDIRSDVSISSMDETVEQLSENKIEKKKTRGRKPKKIFSLSETTDSIDDREILVESENKIEETAVVEEMDTEKINENANEIKKDNIVEQPLEKSTLVETKENDAQIFTSIEQKPSILTRDADIDKSLVNYTETEKIEKYAEIENSATTDIEIEKSETKDPEVDEIKIQNSEVDNLKIKNINVNEPVIKNPEIVELKIKDAETDESETKDSEVKKSEVSEVAVEKVVSETTEMEDSEKLNNELPLDSPASILSDDGSDKHSSPLQEVSGSELDESTAGLDLSTPKKRVVGNFSVVTKSGRILIVEKKKKLTKEAAKFFCAVCTTSFTRKSSLKKHNSSQSHILQLAMIGKEVERDDTTENSADDDAEKTADEDKDEESRPEGNVEIQKEVGDLENPENLIIQKPEKTTSQELIEQAIEKPIELPIEKPIELPIEKPIELPIEKPIELPIEKPIELPIEKPIELPIEKSVELPIENSIEQLIEQPIIAQPIVQPIELMVKSKIATPVSEVFSRHTPILPDLPFFAHKSPEQLEDEMLDEEICKITENMSHDEYVLTDHVSPVTPEATSTPAKPVIITSVDNVVAPITMKIPKKKKEKKEKKKKNLADEHLSLDTPVPTQVLHLEVEKSFNLSSDGPDILVNEGNVTNANVDSILDVGQEIDKFNDLLGKSSELESSVEQQTINNKKEAKSKKNSERKADDGKRGTRNRSQNVDQIVSFTENTRPKRNQLRPSYKEDENFDFDIELPKDLAIEVNKPAKFKVDEKLVNVVDTEESDFEKDNSARKTKENSKPKRDQSGSNITETEASDVEKEILTEKKTGGRKNKKKAEKLEKENDPELSVTENSLKEKTGEELSFLETNVEKILDEKLELSEKEESITEKKITEELDNLSSPPKKKRGRKPKKALETEKLAEEELALIENKSDSVEECALEKEEHVIDEQLSTSQKQSKSKKNQSKKSKKNARDTEALKETSKDNILTEESPLPEEVVQSKIEQPAVELAEIERLKPNILLDSSSELLNTITQRSELSIPLPPDELQKSLVESKKASVDLLQQHPIFPCLSNDNAFKTFDESRNEMLTGFDSDENSLDTNMSVDIQKLLDDPEMTTEIAKQPGEENSQGAANVQPVDVINVKEPLPRDLPTPTSATTATEDETATEIKTPSELKDQEKSKSPSSTAVKSVGKKSPKCSKPYSGKAKRRNRKPKSKTRVATSASDDSGPDESQDNEVGRENDRLQKGKNKIVKSVFGRVFGGSEKTDKVKEVLDDWQSRSEHNSESEDSEPSTAHGNSGKSRNSRSRTRKGSSGGANGEGFFGRSVEAASGGRSRQSKKRAEELISRAFHEDSPLSDGRNKNPKLSRRPQTKSVSPSKLENENKDPNEDDNNDDDDGGGDDGENKEARQSTKSTRGKKRKEVPTPLSDSKQGKYAVDEEEEEEVEENDENDEELVDKSEDSQASTFDREKTLPCTGPEDNDDPVDEDSNGRTSAPYARDSSEEREDAGRSFSASSDVEDEPVRVRKSRRPRRKPKSKSRFDKLATRSSPSLSSRQQNGPDKSTEMVIIGLTDALEDNALDLDLDEEKPPRQQTTKVLNFDEELFVECCSRLKASEKELRGTKKIKLDHSAEEQSVPGAGSSYHHHHRRDEQVAGHKTGHPRDRWRDVESQNSLGSLLESVNQLLGEDYNSSEREYTSASTKRGRNHHHHHHHHHHNSHHHGHHHHHHNSHHHGHHHHHHHHHSRHNNASGRSSPEDGLLLSRQPDLLDPGYDDSLDVAFEHNNKLRDKIQRRMRESESLIATSFGQHSNTKSHGGSPAAAAEAGTVYHDSYGLDAGKAKINNGFAGLDNALSNLLHANEKHDHNGSTPMKLLAELACARAPTSTTPTVPEKSSKNLNSSLTTEHEQQYHDYQSHDAKLHFSKKSKNPIKELFERKKEQYEKKHLDKIKTPRSSDKTRKQKKLKVSGAQSVIRTNQYRGGMAERKKRRNDVSGGKKKEQFKHQEQQEQSEQKIKDVYDFDDEESTSEHGFSTGPVLLSYRAKTENSGTAATTTQTATREFSMSALLSKTIGDTLSNGKVISELGENLENMLDRKFKDIENYESKGKAGDKSNQENVVGPMDDYVERRTKSKRSAGDHHHSVSTAKHQQSSNKSKKRSTGKSGKKKSRNAWYEDDSSDEFVTRLQKPGDIGVGITKSQRTCSKGKQNLFAEMSSTSSESEFERGPDEDEDLESEARVEVAETTSVNGDINKSEAEQSKDKEGLTNDESQNEESQEEWQTPTEDAGKAKSVSPILDLDNHKKSESELSDHPLIIDENHKEVADLEQRTNSDDETEERTFELDDLYREDSSIIDSDRDELSIVAPEDKSNSTLLNKSAPDTTQSSQDKRSTDKYISLEDALDLLDRPQEEEATADITSPPVKKSRSSKTPSFEVFSKDKRRNIEESQDDEEEEDEEEEEETSRLDELPEKLSGNEKPQRQPENLPLHVFLSRKVQESKKRKQQQLKKLKEEQERERILLELQPTRRQRKCAIGKQGLLAEISSSDEEFPEPCKKPVEKPEERPQRGSGKHRQRESKEKRKERYIEKKHEQMIAKEQKAIEEAILRELEEKRLSAASEASGSEKDEHRGDPAAERSPERAAAEAPMASAASKRQSHRQKSHEAEQDDFGKTKRPKSASSRLVAAATDTENDDLVDGGGATADSSLELAAVPLKKKRPTSKSSQRSAGKKPAKAAEPRTPSEAKKTKRTSAGSGGQRRPPAKNRTSSLSRAKEAKEQPSRRESDLDGDEELKATRSWNKLDEGVGVAIGRRKRAAANQLYYWSSSSDEEVEVARKKESAAGVAAVVTGASVVAVSVQPSSAQDGPTEDDRQEQHGWIVGDSHKRMITMLAMEKQMKEKRRRSENDEQSPEGSNDKGTASAGGGKGKTKKHRNSTS